MAIQAKFQMHLGVSLWRVRQDAQGQPGMTHHVMYGPQMEEPLLYCKMWSWQVFSSHDSGVEQRTDANYRSETDRPCGKCAKRLNESMNQPIKP